MCTIYWEKGVIIPKRHGLFSDCFSLQMAYFRLCHLVIMLRQLVLIFVLFCLLHIAFLLVCALLLTTSLKCVHLKCDHDTITFP